MMTSLGTDGLTTMRQMRPAGDEDGAMAHEELERFGGHLDSTLADLCEGKPLLSEEVASYIAVDFRDGTGPSGIPPNIIARAFRDTENASLFGSRARPWASLTSEDSGARNPAKDRSDSDEEDGVRGLATRGRRKRVVHVESATTGTFFKVYEEVGGTVSRSTWGFRGRDRPAGGENDKNFKQKLTADGNNAELGAEESLARAREIYLNRFNQGLEAGVLFVQGIMAGLSLSMVFTAWMAPSLESFIIAYELQSGEFRRAMFILCTLALMGTEDRLTRARAKRELWKRLTWFRRVEFQVSVFLYVGFLVSTLVCSVADTAIFNARGDNSTLWYKNALDDTRFRRKVLLWHGFNLTRFVLAWSGWFLVCTRVWRASLLGEVMQMELRGQREKLVDAHERFSRLNGRKLDPLPSKELQELEESLRLALGHVERIMDLRNER